MICKNCDGDGHIPFMEECNCGGEDCPGYWEDDYCCTNCDCTGEVDESKQDS